MDIPPQSTNNLRRDEHEALAKSRIENKDAKALKNKSNIKSVLRWALATKSHHPMYFLSPAESPGFADYKSFEASDVHIQTERAAGRPAGCLTHLMGFKVKGYQFFVRFALATTVSKPRV